MMMDSGDVDNKQACQIIREGRIDRFEVTFVVIHIEGKSITIPKEKVDPLVKLGDIVKWNGDKWV